MKKFLSMLLVFAMLLSTFTVTFAATGAEDDPVLISSADELIAAAAEINADGAEGKYYKLTADIDLNNIDWNNYAIGSATVPFKGVFDGNGHKVSNFKIDVPAGNFKEATGNELDLGLFGTVGGDGVIKNIGVENVKIYSTAASTWNARTGGLIGKATDNALIDSCYARDILFNTKETGIGQVGEGAALIAYVNGDGVTVSNCYAVGFVEENDSIAVNAGLIGKADAYGSITNCYSDSTLAIVNSNDTADVTNSYCTNVSQWCANGTTRAGSLVTAAELKGLDDTLGDAYKAGTQYNYEYPVLAWEEDELPDPITGSGTEDDPYVLTVKAHLTEVSLMEETDGVYFELGADIDYENKVVNSYIGTTAAPFKGVFDGKGYVIKNIKFDLPGYEASELSRLGVFGVVGGDAEIKNLGVENITINSSASWGYNGIAGGIAAELQDNATVNGCYVKNLVAETKAEGASSPQLGACGGIAGLVTGEGVTVTNCMVLGFGEKNDSIATEDGLIGKADAIAEISNCYSDTTLACVRTEYAENTTNSYSLLKATWAPGGYTRTGEKVSMTALKGMAETLGGAFKAGGVETNGYPALSWMEVTEITVGEGAGTIDSPYLIADANGLRAVADLVETEGVYFKLVNDIDLGGQVWESYIGSKDIPFKGDFDGNGHVIKNYELVVAGTVERGIFNAVGGNAYIHDLGIENVKVTLATNCSWDSTAGGLIACLYDNAVIAGCFVKDIEFKADYKRTEYWHVELKWGGGLIGYGKGDGIELRDCYSNGFKETYEEGTKAIVNHEGGLFGMLDSFLAVEDCYSDTTMGRYTRNGLAKNSFHVGPTLEWPDGYHWGYNSHKLDVTTLGYDWNNDFIPNEANLPELKWENNEGYINLIPGAEFTGVDPSVFGVAGGEIVVSKDTTRKSTVLQMPAGSAFTYDVDLEEGAYYRVSFRGKSVDGEDTNFVFNLGDVDLTESLVDKNLSERWETKVVFVKADTDNADITVSADADICIDDVEIIKVDVDLEKVAISNSVIFEETVADIANEIFVSKLICDGLEVVIESDYDCVDQDGKLNNNVPVGFGTVDVEVTISATIADEVATATKTFTINKQQPYDVKTLGLVNVDGEKVFGVGTAEKIGTVEVDVNTDEDGKIVAALYKDGKLLTMKYADVVDGESVIDLPVGDADSVKIFAYVADSLMPLSVPEVTYDKLVAGGNVVMHTIGDSLCSTYDPTETDLVGWGQVMGSKLDETYITVDNDLAESGMTANKFFNEGGAKGGINELIAKYKPGDYLLVQLGTNDSSGFLADLKGFTKAQFRFYMDQFISSAREHGVIPVFVTAPERLSIAKDTKTDGVNYDVESILENYPEIMREYGAEFNVPVVDLNAESNRLLKEYGYTGTKELGFFVADELHFSEAGANWIADFVANELVRLGLPVGDCVLAQQ